MKYKIMVKESKLEIDDGEEVSKLTLNSPPGFVVEAGTVRLAESEFEWELNDFHKFRSDLDTLRKAGTRGIVTIIDRAGTITYTLDDQGVNAVYKDMPKYTLYTGQEVETPIDLSKIFYSFSYEDILVVAQEEGVDVGALAKDEKALEQIGDAFCQGMGDLDWKGLMQQAIKDNFEGDDD